MDISRELIIIGSIIFGINLIVTLIAQGFILSATGEKGWKIIIPFYGQWMFYKRTCDNGGLYIASLICLLVSNLLYFIVPVLGLYFMLMPMICTFLLSINLSIASDRSTAFGFGLFFLPLVFYSILAFGNKNTIRYQTA